MKAIKAHFREILIHLLIFVLFLANYAYVFYPDEFVNLLGGVAILEGKLPYRDFFDHHLPLAWYLSAPLLLISFKSYLLFRFWWTVLIFAGLFTLGRWLRRHHKEIYPYYLGFFALYPALSLYFWFHLYLGDSLAIIFFTLTFWILLAQTISQKIQNKAILVASFLTFCMIFSSMTFAYLGAALYLWQAYLLRDNLKKVLVLIAVSLVPYLLYLIYLLASGTFSDFYFSNITYNTSLYISIPNYTRGRFFNPLKFAMTLIFNFYNGYFPLLSKIKHLDLYLPIGVLAGLSTLTLTSIFLYRQPIIGILLFLVLSFSAPRSDVQAYKETDYQMGLFLALGTICAFVVAYLLQRSKTANILLEDLRRVVQFLIVIFLFFSSIFLFKNAYDKYYLRYTQKIPSIMSTSYGSGVLDKLLNEGDYFWIGPYEPHQAYFVKKGRLPGKYPTLLPQFRENDYLKRSFIEQFEKNPPKVIVYIHEASIFGTPALEFGKFFTDWMADKYTAVEHIEGLTVKNSPSEFNLRTDLYLSNRHQPELLEKLRNENFID